MEQLKRGSVEDRLHLWRSLMCASAATLTFAIALCSGSACATLLRLCCALDLHYVLYVWYRCVCSFMCVLLPICNVSLCTSRACRPMLSST